MKKILLIVLFTLSFTLQAEKRVALVIGNANYQDSMGKLPNPRNDANDMSAALSTLGFDVIKGVDVNKKQLTEMVREFDKKLSAGNKSENIGLFYYAGHGMEIEGTNYLIPVDATMDYQEDAQFEGVSLNKIISRMKYTGNRLNMVILDACRNNPLPKKTRSSAGGWGAYNEVAQGMFIAYGTSPGRKASDGDGRNGLFTKHLLNNIRKKGKTLEQVFKATRQAVLQESGGKQLTWSNNATIGDFYFVQTLSGFLNSNLIGVKMTPEQIKKNNVEAQKAFNNKNYISSLSLYLKSANEGNANAQAYVGYQYNKGLGVEQNYSKALQWYLKAAAQNNAASLYNLGVFYDNGYGVVKNESHAIEYFKKAAALGQESAIKALERRNIEVPKQTKLSILTQAEINSLFQKGKEQYFNKDYSNAYQNLIKSAEQGHAESQFYLGSMYSNGYGVTKDNKKAFEWDLKAAKQNHNKANFNVGRAYHYGYGTDKDYTLAMNYYKKAADNNLASANFSIGLLYESGLGVRVNKPLALTYFKKAAKGGYQLAIDTLKKRNITNFD